MRQGWRAFPWLKTSVLLLAVVASLATGYLVRQGTVAGLKAVLEERDKRLVAAQEERAQLEMARLETIQELSKVSAQRDQGVAAIEALRSDNQELNDALRLQAEILEVSLQTVDLKEAEALLLVQQGLDAGEQGEYGVEADLFERAAHRYDESRLARETVADKSETLAAQVPAGVQETYDLATRRARSATSLAAASTAEFLAAAHIYSVIDWLRSEGQFATAQEARRQLLLLDNAQRELEQGGQFLDDAQTLTPKLEQLVEARRFDLRGWQSLYDDVRSVIESLAAG